MEPAGEDDKRLLGSDPQLYSRTLDLVRVAWGVPSRVDAIVHDIDPVGFQACGHPGPLYVTGDSNVARDAGRREDV